MRGPIIRKCVEALSSLPVRGIVTLGEQLNAQEFASTKNVVVTQSAPHRLVLEQASAIITHCGHGTAIKAMCAVCRRSASRWARSKRHRGADRARGAGVRLKTKASVTKIANSVGLVLADRSYRTKAKALGARINAELAAKGPVDTLLEALPGADLLPGTSAAL